MGASDARSGAGQKSASKQVKHAAPAPPRNTPERSADTLAALRASEREGRMMVAGVSVALAIFIPIARQVWSWLREERVRARVDREILRDLGA